MEEDTMILVFLMLSFKPAFSLSSLSRDSLVPLHFLWLEWYQPHIWDCWYFNIMRWLWTAVDTKLEILGEIIKYLDSYNFTGLNGWSWKSEEMDH